MKMKSKYLGWLATLAFAGAALPAQAVTYDVLDLRAPNTFVKVPSYALPGTFAYFTTHVVDGSSGTGKFQPFVKLDDKKIEPTDTNDPTYSPTGTEKGYNTSATSPYYQEATSPWTGDLLRSQVQLMDQSGYVELDPLPGGLKYREFGLDANQNNSNSYLALTDLKIFLSSLPGLNGSVGDLAGDTINNKLVFDLDGGGVDRTILLNPNLSGSGAMDMLSYFPQASALPTGAYPYIYFYSQFGNPAVTLNGTTYDATTNDGFEEWNVRKGYNDPNVVPAPAALLGGLFAFGQLGRLRRRVQAARADAAA